MIETLSPRAQPAARPNGRQLNKFFKALSDETRRSILGLLEEREHTVGEIVGNFDLSQPTISRHLAVLKEARLVIDQRHGQHVIYRLADGNLAHSVDQFFGAFEQCRRSSVTVQPRIQRPSRLSL